MRRSVMGIVTGSLVPARVAGDDPAGAVFEAWDVADPSSVPTQRAIADLLNRFDADVIIATIHEARYLGWPLGDQEWLLGRLHGNTDRLLSSQRDRSFER